MTNSSDHGIQRSRGLRTALLLLLLGSIPALAAPSIDYDVSVDLPTETFRVHGTLKEIATGDTLVYLFPIWGPGAYDIITFGGYVVDFRAQQGGRTLGVTRRDSSTFLIAGAQGGQPVTIDYRVRDIERVPNSLWFGLTDIEPHLVFANTVAIFGYPQGGKNVPGTVSFETPKGWKMTVGLDPLPGKRNSYRVHDYDELVDMPMQMGKFQTVEFTLQGKPHIITVTSRKPLSRAELNGLRDTTKMIVGWCSSLFGDMPYDRYIFQHYLIDGREMQENDDFSFGALEHRNSSSYRMPLGPDQTPAQLLAGVIAHEYWHLWSPKRIHVAELGPFDYQRPPRTASLWFAEGLTEYFANVILSRHGMDDDGGLLGKLNGNGGRGVFQASYRRPQRESMAALSMRFSEAPMQEIVAVYSKGPVVGMLLDITLRDQTANRVTLDSIFRYFNRQYGQTGRTFTDEEIIPIMERASGARLQEFYDRYIAGVEPLPYDELLPKGGFRIAEAVDTQRALGAVLRVEDDVVRVESITPGGSADAMGLRGGDVVTGLSVSDSMMAIADVLKNVRGIELAELVRYLPRGTEIAVRRGDAVQMVRLRLIPTPVTVQLVEPDPRASGLPLAIRRDIIGA